MIEIIILYKRLKCWVKFYFCINLWFFLSGWKSQDVVASSGSYLSNQQSVGTAGGGQRSPAVLQHVCLMQGDMMSFPVLVSFIHQFTVKSRRFSAKLTAFTCDLWPRWLWWSLLTFQELNETFWTCSLLCWCEIFTTDLLTSRKISSLFVFKWFLKFFLSGGESGSRCFRPIRAAASSSSSSPGVSFA